MRIKTSARQLALECLRQLEESNSSIASVVNQTIRRSNLSRADRGLLNELVYGTIRWRKQIDWVLKQLVNPRFQLDLRTRNLLRLGTYQLLHLDRIPPHAAIYETVELAKPKRKATGFVNGVLRAVQRDASDLQYPSLEWEPAGHIATSLSYPLWLVERWIAQRGIEWTLKFCRASNKVAPLSIRVNTLKTSRTDFIESLVADGAPATESCVVPDGLLLVGSPHLQSLKAYQDGLFYVQDESAMLVAHLLQPQPGAKVVDLCAAPGGKTTHIAQLMGNSGEIVAIDFSEEKIQRMGENCKRLGVTNVQLCTADVTSTTLDFIKDADAVLVDVPCSGLGTLRRHPDIRWNRQPKQIGELTELQLQILGSVAPHIKPGGVLVYSTCSSESEENEGVIHRFLETAPRFIVENAKDYLPTIPSNATTSEGFLQTFPHEHGVDGAFAARLRATT